MIFRIKKEVKRCRAFLRSALSGNRSPEAEGSRILMYHSIGGSPEDHRLATRVPEDLFAKHIEEIAGSGRRVITVSEMVDGGENLLRDKCIAITFDDGYKDNALCAAVKLKQFGMRATFFVTVSYIDNTVNKNWANGLPRKFMTWEDVKDISDMGFEIGSHMLRHVDLTSLSEEDLYDELKKSKDIISSHIGRPIDTCSYPYGCINDKVVSMVKKAGYKAACSSFYGLNTPSTDSYILRRTEIDGYDTINSFKLKINGFYD